MLGKPPNATAAEPGDGKANDASATFDLIREHMVPALALAQKLTGADAIEVTAAGAEVTLSDGRTVLDFGSYGLTLLGHRPPTVVAAVQAQLHTLPTSTRALANGVSAALAARLVSLTDPQRLTRVWLGQDGADAVEAAIKLARAAAKRPIVLAVRGGFHGKTLGALAATWQSRYRDAMREVLVGVRFVEEEPDAVERALAAGDVAALLFEPIQGEGGVHELPADLLREWCDAARAAGAFVISDEVQMGLRRGGAISLAMEAGLSPDAVLFGKHLAGGVLPLSAVVASDRMFAPLMREPFLHTSSFSGHPLSCAASLAALDAIEAHADRGAELAVRIEDGLRLLARAHEDVVAHVGGRGLAWGLSLRTRELAGEVLAELGPNGLVVSPCLGRPDVIRLLPPIVTTLEQIDRALTILDAACSHAHAATRPAAVGA